MPTNSAANPGAGDRLIARYLALPAWLRDGMLRRAIAALPHTRRPRGLIGRLKRFVASADPSRERQYVRYLCAFTNEGKAGLYTPEFAAATAETDSVALVEELYRRADGEDFLDRTLFVDLHSYLPDDILVKVDIASMAHSLEARSPLLDHELLALAFRLPSSLKLRGLSGTKWILRRAFRDVLPPSILQRGKMGFGIPVHEFSLAISVEWATMRPFGEPMKDDDFDLRKTGRFRVPPEEAPADNPDEPTQKREPPTRRPRTDAKTDPAFDRRKTQIFHRRALRPEPREPEGEQDSPVGEAPEREPITGEYVSGTPRRSQGPTEE